MNILLLDEIGKAVLDGFRMLMLDLCNLIYKLIIFCFGVFESIGSNTSLITNDSITNIFKNISLILGLFMIFRITFSFIEYIIDPDKMTDKSKGYASIIKKIIISIILLGSVSAIFNFAYEFQDAILDDEIIPRLILGNNSLIDEIDSGSVISYELFNTFFRIRSDLSEEEKNDHFYKIIDEELKEGNFETIYTTINEKDDKDEYYYEFDAGGLAAVVIGCLGLYIIVIFTIQVTIRLFQLTYLQIISPIPIMMYITPKGEENLKKWGRQCLTTYLDFFIRCAIMYFVIFIINNVSYDKTNGISSFWTKGDIVGNAYIMALLIIGLLLFAKKLPNLLKEILPSMGGGAAGFSYDLGFKKNITEPLKMAYNAPVIGWGLKAPMAIGRGIDRATHGKSFFGESKLRKGIDKALPEQAAARKKRMEAQQILDDNNEFERMGGKIFNKYGDELTSDAFTHKEYQQSFDAVKSAKDKVKETSEALRKATSACNAAYTSRDPKIIAEAEAKYKEAEKADKIAQARFEKEKEKHEQLQKIYGMDAQRENAYKYYTDRNPDKVEEWKSKHPKKQDDNKILISPTIIQAGPNLQEGPTNTAESGNGVANEGTSTLDNNDNAVPRVVKVKPVKISSKNAQVSPRKNDDNK